MTFCYCCQADRPRLYCADCLQEGVNQHLSAAKNSRNQCIAAAARATTVLNADKGFHAWRKLRAEVAAREERCQQLRQSIEATERAIEQLRAATIKAVRVRRPEQDKSKSLKRALVEVKRKERDTCRSIVHARVVLVGEAVNIFRIAKSRGRWEISGIPLPLPEDMRDYPSVTVNASIGHCVHLLSLITRYLSITLPFTPTYSKAFHIGRPTMRPNLPFLNTTKFRERTQLWMSTTAHKRDSRSLTKHRQFLTAFALLSHSIGYLAWTQGVEGIGVDSPNEVGPEAGFLIQTPEVLRIIAGLAESPNLGHKSHEPGSIMCSHLGFSLDVSKVVQYVLRLEEGQDEVDGDGWDIVDASRIH